MNCRPITAPLDLAQMAFLSHSIGIKNDHLVIIDGHHLMYRAYWAIPRTLKTSSGEQNNTVFGVASMLLAILSTEKPERLLFAFDEGDETFRHEANETYKEGRQETPDDFYAQIPRVMELIDAFSMHSVSGTKYEADDYIATYAVAAEKQGTKVTIVSGDKDLYQMASDNVRIAIPHKGYQQAEYLDPDGVESKLGIRPDQVVSFKGLCGDSSDNLPGVMGIGPKTAATLLQKYDTLEGVYEHLDDIKGTVREKLTKDRDQAFFCATMAALVTDIPLTVSLDELKLEDLPSKDIMDFFQEMEFTLLFKRFQSLLQTDFGTAHFADGEEIATAAPTKKKDQLSLFV